MKIEHEIAKSYRVQCPLCEREFPCCPGDIEHTSVDLCRDCLHHRRGNKHLYKLRAAYNEAQKEEDSPFP